MPCTRRHTKGILIAAAAVVLAATAGAAFPGSTRHCGAATVAAAKPGTGTHPLLRDHIELDLDEDHRHPS
ncbi:hypothetical protein GCM10022284_44060 [Streptomyces hundungensis]